MKVSKDQKKLGALVILIVLLVTGTVFSIQRAIAPSPGARIDLTADRTAQGQRRYASNIPDELTPPGEETPINTPAPTNTPRATATPGE